MQLAGVIINLNGSLIEYDEIRYDTFNDILSEFSQKISRFQWENEYRFLETKDIIRDLVIDRDLNIDEKKFQVLFDSIEKKTIKFYGVPIVEGLKNFLSYLKLKNIKVLIASDFTKEFTKFLISNSDLPKLEFVSREEYDKTKPYSDCYEVCLRKLNLSYDKIIVFENTISGIVGSQKVTPNVCGVNFYETQNLYKVKIIKNIKNYNELDFFDFVNQRLN